MYPAGSAYDFTFENATDPANWANPLSSPSPRAMRSIAGSNHAGAVGVFATKGAFGCSGAKSSSSSFFLSSLATTDTRGRHWWRRMSSRKYQVLNGRGPRSSSHLLVASAGIRPQRRRMVAVATAVDASSCILCGAQPSCRRHACDAVVWCVLLPVNGTASAPPPPPCTQPQSMSNPWRRRIYVRKREFRIHRPVPILYCGKYS